MKANKALRRLAKIEALISDVTERYSTYAPHTGSSSGCEGRCHSGEEGCEFAGDAGKAEGKTQDQQRRDGKDYRRYKKALGCSSSGEGPRSRKENRTSHEEARKEGGTSKGGEEDGERSNRKEGTCEGGCCTGCYGSWRSVGRFSVRFRNRKRTLERHPGPCRFNAKIG